MCTGTGRRGREELTRATDDVITWKVHLLLGNEPPTRSYKKPAVHRFGTPSGDKRGPFSSRSMSCVRIRQHRSGSDQFLVLGACRRSAASGQPLSAID